MILWKAKASVIGQVRITGAFLFLKAVILTVLNLNGEDISWNEKDERNNY